MFAPNHFQAGQLAATEFCHRTLHSAPQKIAVVLGGMTETMVAPISVTRFTGFKETVLMSCPKHEFVVEAIVPVMDFARIRVIAAGLFLSYPGITTAWTADDMIAVQVIEGVRAAGLGAELQAVIGFSARQLGKPYLGQGILAVTVDNQQYYHGSGLLHAIVSFAQILPDMAKDTGHITTVSITEQLKMTPGKPAIILTPVVPVVPQIERWLVRNVLNNYDASERPKPKSCITDVQQCTPFGPTVVRVELQAERIYSIDQIAGTYAIDGHLRLWWYDDRLAFGHLTAGGLGQRNGPDFLHFEPSSSIWRPGESYCSFTE